MNILDKKILDKDGELYYYEDYFTKKESQEYFNDLLKNILWERHTLRYGKTENRDTAFYGPAGMKYPYSGAVRIALPWNKTLLELKEKVEKSSEISFNCVLLTIPWT